MRITTEFRFQIAPLMFLMVTVASGQASNKHTLSDAIDYRSALDQYFEGHRKVADAQNMRFAVTLQILPPFGKPREINILYGLDKRASVRMTTLEQPLGVVLADFTSRNHRLPSGDELSILVGSRQSLLSIERKTAIQWLSGLWEAVSGVARRAPTEAIGGEASGEVEIVLDPTIYIIEYTDTDKHFELSVGGREPGGIVSNDKRNPLIKWIIGVSRQCDALSKFNAQ